jgi:hypothetical protein
MQYQYEYYGEERSHARTQGLVSAILTMLVVASLRGRPRKFTRVLAAALCLNHLNHFYYFSIRTNLGHPSELHAILTGPHRPMFWPAPLLIAYGAAAAAYPALLFWTLKALKGEQFGTKENLSLILFWSIFVYFYTDRFVSDIFFVEFDAGRVLYTASILLGLGSSMHYSRLVGSVMQKQKTS